MRPTAATSDLMPDELAEVRRYSLLIAWSPENDAYVVSVPEIPGLHSHGATHEEAIAMGEEAIATWLTGLRKLGRPVPAPRFAAVSVG